MRPETGDDGIIRTNCAHCGAPIGSDRRKQWLETVNLTPDGLSVGGVWMDFDEAVVDADIAFDWCNVACFGRALFKAAGQVMP